MIEETGELESEIDEIIQPESRSEVYEYFGGAIIFPRGAELFADQVGALAIRIPEKTGDIEILRTGQAWKVEGKADRTASATNIRTIKPLTPP